MNVYDFDYTIYDGDSTLNFYIYCVKRYPKVLLYFPKQLYGFIGYKVNILTKLEFKEYFYSFLSLVPNIDEYVDAFWKNNKHNIKSWYIDQKKDSDVVISASPYFLLHNICKELGIQYLIASNVDNRNGKCLDNNCYGHEKVRRFIEIFPNESIDNFYSDSYSDEPMAKYACHAYLVKGNNIQAWFR